MSLSNIQAQLGNILAAMPLKLQKVSTDFLDETAPPLEGAVASSESGSPLPDPRGSVFAASKTRVLQ